MLSEDIQTSRLQQVCCEEEIGSGRLENVKLMQMEDSEWHRACDCMESNGVTVLFPCLGDNVCPHSGDVRPDMNSGAKVSETILDEM